MKNKNTIITVVVVIILAAIAVGATAFKNDDSKTAMTNNDMMDMSMPENGTMNSNMSSENSQAVEGNQVTYKGFAVSPKTLKVKKGTTVTWTNQDDAKHDVTPITETADFKASELFGKGESHIQ
jgi:plastocyanin